MAVAVTPNVQSGVYPPRVAVAVTGLASGVDFLAVYRRVDGQETLLRAGQILGTVPDSSVVVVDAELPFGIPVTYVAVVNSTDRYESSATEYTLTGGKVALSDAITGLSVECQTFSRERVTRNRLASVFRVAGRNIVVSGDLGQFEADTELFTETSAAAAQMRSLLANATEAVVQYRSSDADVYETDAYFAVTSFDEVRYSQDGSDPRRTWVLHVVETDPWAFSLTTATYTYGDVLDFYSPGTYADLLADNTTYLDLLTKDWQ